MRNVIVTGGLGFIGSNLVRKLSKKYFVNIVDKETYSSNIINLNGIDKKKYKINKFNINNFDKFFKLLQTSKPECIFNLAAETHVDRSIDNPRSFMSSNIVGTFTILEALRKFYKKNKKTKLVQISTDEVYGDIPKNKFSLEKDAFRPSSPYAASKASSDHLVNAYYRTYKLPVIISNCCNNYGPRQFLEKLIPKLIFNIINNKNLPIYGNGTNQREWIHVDDHNDALIKIFKKGKIGDTYNIGSGEVFTNLDICEMLLNIFNKKLKLHSNSKIIFVKDRPGHDKRYALNSKKLKNNLGWKKKYNISEGLTETFKWYIENENNFKKIKNKVRNERLGLKL